MRIFILAAFMLFSLKAFSGTISGYIYDEQGKPLPFATIYVKETGSGTVANADAYYEIKLAPGKYQLVFQFIGYSTTLKEVSLENENVQLNVTLQPEAIVLREVEVRAGKEDPAYSIMRRAIAKAGFHLNQLDSFSAKVYIKGTGQVKDVPFFLRKTLEKEGIDTSKVFISESVNEVTFIRPDTYRERVISVRSSGDDNNTNPNAYIFTSFYQPEIAGTISPLSPKAFAYYRFSYEGTFEDRGVEVSKIKVTPRSKGDNVFDGYLHIVEDLWSIHSLQLQGVKLGITFKVDQIYAPVEENLWMPVSHKIMFFGSVLGFEFEYKYLASVSDYNIVRNPDLNFELTVIDEKTAPEEAKAARNEEVEKLEELVSTKTTSRKQLRKLVKEYEKLEKEMEEEPEVVSRRYFSVDSTAYKVDSSYWNSIRPIPLTKKETEGYQEVDSVAQVEKSMAEGDTIKYANRKSGFQVKDILFGDRFSIGEKSYFEIKNVLGLINFNTVEGLNAEYQLVFSRTTGENNSFIRFSPLARYGFAREKLNGKATFQYGFGEYTKRSNLIISGGRYIEQFNREEPIHPIVNSFMTLLWERNYMKIYEQDFISASYNRIFGDKINVSVSTILSERHELENHSDYTLVDRDAVKSYLPNDPYNIEIGDTSFPIHQAFVTQVHLNYQPWLKYRIRNDKKNKIDESSPVFSLMYRKGIPVGNTDVDYDFLEAGVKHKIKNGVRGTLDISLTGGKFLNRQKLYFMDFKHFSGNRTPIVTLDRAGSFRLLDYYLFSTNDEYFTTHANYQFRKFLATQFTFIRMMGLRESLIVNYLAAPASDNYVEVGYSLDYILRVLRVEAVTSFVDGKYYDFGVRLGLAIQLFSFN